MHKNIVCSFFFYILFTNVMIEVIAIQPEFCKSVGSTFFNSILFDYNSLVLNMLQLAKNKLF